MAIWLIFLDGVRRRCVKAAVQRWKAGAGLVPLKRPIVTARRAVSNGAPVLQPAIRENGGMPLPNAPTRRPNNVNTRLADKKAGNDLLIKGILCVLIGLGVLLSPYFITSPGMQGIVAQASLVGWFALVLGCAFVGVFVVRRLKAPAGS